MKLLNTLLLLFLFAGISGCSEDREIGDDDFDIQREQEYNPDDIRENELELEN